MNWTIIVIEALVLTALFTAMILIPLVKNPVWWIADYPEDIQEEYFKTHERIPSKFFTPTVLLKKGMALFIALALLLLVVWLAGAYDFWSALGVGYGIWLFIDWYDCFILDWVLFANMKSVRLPGTEHMDEAYHQKKYHFVQSCWGMLIGLIPCLIGAGIYALLISGNPQSECSIPFTEAHNYFVRNDVTEPIPAKIGSQDEFERYFGMAAFMGKNGQPTPIDFEKQFAIAVVLPETNHSTELHAESLIDDGQKLTFTYHVDVAPEENTWTQAPMLLIFVDRQYERNSVELQSNFVADISGTWQVRAFDDIMLTEDSVLFPTISFMEKGVITASAGCNGMGGNYQYANGQLIIKDGMCQTEMWCENEQMMRNERLLAQTLHDTLAVTSLSADSVLVQGTHTMIIVR